MPYGDRQSPWLCPGPSEWLARGCTAASVERWSLRLPLGIQAGSCVFEAARGGTGPGRSSLCPRSFSSPQGQPRAPPPAQIAAAEGPCSPPLLPARGLVCVRGKGQTKAQQPHHFSPLHPLAQPFLPFIMYFNRSRPR